MANTAGKCHRPTLYYTTDDFTNTRLATGSLNILSLNCQSLNAKFNELQIFIEEMCHNQFGVICLQESWLDNNFEYSMFNLRNYSMIKQGKLCSEHGGLIMSLTNTTFPHL